MKKIAIWGLGDRAHVFMKFDFFHKHRIVACIDTAKRNEKLYDRDVYEPEWLLNNIEDLDYLVITTYHFSEIYNWCINIKIPREKIILTDLVKDPIFEQKLEVIEAEFPTLYEHMKNMQYGLIKMNETDIYDDKRLVGQGKYAFVSIDVDFEASIHEGLQFFYPRLEEGGYIFVHDYTNPQLTGVKAAVRRYEESIGTVLKKVPLADWAGTLVILK